MLSVFLIGSAALVCVSANTLLQVFASVLLFVYLTGVRLEGSEAGSG